MTQTTKITLIVVGSTVGAILIGGSLYYYWVKRKQKEEQARKAEVVASTAAADAQKDISESDQKDREPGMAEEGVVLSETGVRKATSGSPK